ncbi:ABC transporter permease (plasmid) [Leisingera sp. M527]|uniref:ABC transporter permease n=1 Tax=Leisingera sp. M527 TaxID=2867014 RepID=UPI0021A73ECF|nr:ABC transporter permease [Leisingera sp. M527]UWQ35617.1 ABC transporter permease [Leisingera sp. M527]
MTQETATAPSENYNSSKLKEILMNRAREFGMPVALIMLVIYFSASSDVFLTGQNMRNVALQAAALAAVAIGQTFVVLNADLDLSVGSIVALVSVVASMVMAAYGAPVGIMVGLVTGALVGLINGLVVTRFRVMAFIATLAMLSIAQGVALNISKGIPITGVPGSFADIAFARFLGLPVPFLISLVLFVAAAVTLHYTRLGRNIYAVGGNSAAARLSGIPVRKTQTWAYVISGICAAVASLILTARVGSGQPTLGSSLALESVAAVVLGGVSLFGGRGSIIGVGVGVAFVSILSNGLNLLNVSSYTQLMIVGIALIAAVAVDQAMSKQK